MRLSSAAAGSGVLVTEKEYSELGSLVTVTTWPSPFVEVVRCHAVGIVTRN